ncbi:MAG: cell wall metabolism sensor histidine kinase WalK [Chitinophagales bacterium]|nr:cell wall metabolism sensor histidine kinase WalK [Chitinophagales bacterium]
MKIKTKLTLGVGLLFAMITSLAVLSSMYINKLSNNTENILTDNYNSIVYCRQMLIAINNDIATPEAQTLFQFNLNKEKQTITEVSEKELVEKISLDFEAIKKNPIDSSIIKLLHEDITDIMLLNMQALQRKSKVATQTSEEAIIWIATVGTICFVIALMLFDNLPSNIANPIKELTESIKQIAAKNYSKRVHFESHNEYGELAQSFNVMAKKLEEYSNSNLERLMMAKKRIETLINNMREPVIGLDEHFMVLFMNDTALQICNLKKEDVIGKSISEISKRNDLIRTLTSNLLNSSLQEQNEKPLLIKIYADNKESYFEKEIIPIKIVPTGEKEEKNIGNVILLKNITSFKELDFAKTNFIGTVSHELKTPISSIKMSIQLLENKKIGSLNPEQQNLIENIKDDTSRLLKIIGELLNITQVESGAIQLNKTPTTITEIIEYATNATKSTAEQKEIDFDIDIAKNIAPILADKEKTAWVITNLLSNAIRYADENTSIKIKAQETDNHKVEISVTDIGQGILPEYLDKIFDRYFRVPGTKKDGTGLGLSICKEFIEAQGGTITVKSEYGVGSTFTVNI